MTATSQSQLRNWLIEQRPVLDSIIANSARHRLSVAKDADNYGFDLAQCQYESFKLMDNEDLCYDRPNTPLVYSLWYHPRRINTFLSYFLDSIFKANQPKIEIFDLGAGTGAIQWAIGLIYHGMKELGIQTPEIRLINIDTSPFMLYYSRDYLWKLFIETYHHAKDLQIEYEINSWSNSTKLKISNPWIVASYLFDVSDTYGGEVNLDYRQNVKTGFIELIQSFDPSAILLLTSSQAEKKKLLLELRDEFRTLGYSFQVLEDTGIMLKGNLEQINKLRGELSTAYSDQMKDLGAPRYSGSLNRLTSWEESKFIASILTRQQVGLALSPSLKREQKIRLFSEPIKVRNQVDLNDDQKKAAEHADRPTIILGPAGCGKSIVLTERIKNLIVARNFASDLNILVTTFNKDLLASLGNWIEELLQSAAPGRFSRAGAYFYFSGNNTGNANITLLSFDKLPTQLGVGLKHSDIGYNNYHHPIASACIEQVKKERNITGNSFDKILTIDYVLDEYHRVIYGLQYSKKEEYMTAPRKGRPRLQASGREILWDIIVDKYLVQIKKDSFISKRHRFLQQLKRGEVSVKFSHIFLDEFQDCTEADYSIFYHLLSDPNNLIMAGDVAQAIQLGSVADVPRADADTMQRRAIFRLKGSYRLPFRISECIAEISKRIENGNVLSPYKGSPPGARPIVVYGENDNVLAKKVKSICNWYSVYGFNSISVLENDPDLGMALTLEGVPYDLFKILKIKGLEKSCVLWSSRMDIDYKQEVEEFIHTIMTRTSSVLIIALFPNTLPKYVGILKLLRADRLILWDAESKNKFDELCKAGEHVENLDQE